MLYIDSSQNIKCVYNIIFPQQNNNIRTMAKYLISESLMNDNVKVAVYISDPQSGPGGSPRVQVDSRGSRWIPETRRGSTLSRKKGDSQVK